MMKSDIKNNFMFKKVLPVAKYSAIIISLTLLYGETVKKLFAVVLNPFNFSDDVRQHIFPLYRYLDADLFKGDYVANYYLDGLPIGYKAAFAIAAPFIDPVIISKLIPYFLYLVTIIAVGLVSYRLGGTIASWGSMALCLGCDIYLMRMTGGLPRSFAFPIFACAMAALVYERYWMASVCVWIGAAFYPVCAVTMGISLALSLMIHWNRKDAIALSWSIKKKLYLIICTALVSILLVLPPFISSQKYGPSVKPGDTEIYPESGPGGRYFPEERPPFEGFFQSVYKTFITGMTGKGTGKPWVKKFTLVYGISGRKLPIFDLFMLFNIIGWGLLFYIKKETRLILTICIGVFAGYFIARVFAPYFFLPQRYLLYPTILLSAIMLPNAALGWILFLQEKIQYLKNWFIKPGIMVVWCLALIFFLSSRDHYFAGFMRVNKGLETFSFLKTLPKDVVIAGWPDEIIDNVPYLSRRIALLNYETHQAFHVKYVLEMRRRMNALLDAYFATSIEPILNLRDQFGVTHLIINKNHFTGKWPEYFKPFNSWIENKKIDSSGKKYKVMKLLQTTAVFQEGPYVVLDLSLI